MIALSRVSTKHNMFYRYLEGWNWRSLTLRQLQPYILTLDVNVAVLSKDKNVRMTINPQDDELIILTWYTTSIYYRDIEIYVVRILIRMRNIMRDT